MADIEEAKAALRACLGACDLPVGVSFTFDSGKEKNRTMMGVTPAQAWKAAHEGVRFIGGCCGSTPAHVAAIVATINSIRAPHAQS